MLLHKVWAVYAICTLSGPLFIWFMINYDIYKDLNIFLSLKDQATPLTLENNLGIIIGSKPEKVENIKTQKKLDIFIRNSVYLRNL